jgi:hypothetical protein
VNIVAFSGGKDSTALALRLHELGEDFECLFTPTGNELPELRAHIDLVMGMVGKTLIVPANQSLEFWMKEFNALPNNRMRWCTRLIKIVPCIEYLKSHPGSTLIIGLRADEEVREGLYGPYATYRYPLREWGWGKRTMLLVRHSVLWFVPVEKLQQICSDLPPEVVEALVHRGRNSDRNVEVIVNLSSGGQQDRKKAEAVQQFGMIDDQPNSPTFGQRVIGLKTLRTSMGVDNEKEEGDQQAGLMMMQQVAQQMAAQQAEAGKGPPKGKAGSNGNGHEQPAGGRFGGEQ